MKKRRTKRVLAAAVGAAVAVVVVAGCSATQAADSEPLADTGQEATAQEEGTWKDRWPAEYYSFVNGTNSASGAGGVTMAGDDVAGHGVILDTLKFGMMPSENPAYDTNWDMIWDNTFPQDNTCLACKTSKFNDFVAADGYMAQLDRYDLDSLTDSDAWDCGMCHADINDPAGSLGNQSVGFQRVGGTLAKTLDTKQIVCAQCHTATGFWIDGINNGKVDLDSDAEVDPYKYGTDPASTLKMVEECATEESKRYIDKENGIYIFLSFTEPRQLEAFQGSVMEQLGVGCTDCHMPTITEDDGATYTSHNASGSPLDNMASLKYCLTCHSSQGIENFQDMKTYVEEAQSKFDVRKAELQEKVDGLFGAIVAAKAAGTDEATLDQARLAYAEASAYQSYAKPSIVHNPKEVYNWMNQEEVIIDEAMALLS